MASTQLAKYCGRFQGPRQRAVLAFPTWLLWRKSSWGICMPVGWASSGSPVPWAAPPTPSRSTFSADAKQSQPELAGRCASQIPTTNASSMDTNASWRMPAARRSLSRWWRRSWSSSAASKLWAVHFGHVASTSAHCTKSRICHLTMSRIALHGLWLMLTEVQPSGVEPWLSSLVPSKF